MKILFTRFPLESRFGGAEVQTLSLMKGLRNHGHEVTFLGSCPTLRKEVSGYGLRVTELDIGIPPVTKWGALSFTWRKKKMQKKLNDELNKIPDLKAIFMLSLSEKLLLTEAATKKDIPVFWVEHDRVGPWLTKNPWLPQLRKLSHLAKTICVSDLSRQIYLDLGWDPKSITAIPNGIDLSRFSALTPTLSPNPGPPLAQIRLGCVARLSPEKGVDLLIQAVSELPEVHLTIIGTGPDEGYLRKLADEIHTREMQSEKRIRILPHVQDLGDFYRSIDALVLPSRDNDPFGLVVAEAMAAGTPVIVTDQCGIAGYLKNGEDAVIVKAESHQALTEALQSLRKPGFARQLAANALVTVQERFSAEKMVERYEDLLR